MQNHGIIDNIYTKIKTLNKGSFYSIYLVRNENNHNQYAAKVMTNEDQQHFNRELQMITIASGLNNPYIIHLNGHGNGPINIGGDVQNRNY